jgi:hypothetical protein
VPRPIDLAVYQREVEAGLPTVARELDEAAERQAFLDNEGTRYERRFRRDAESSFDFQGRSHRQSGFLGECLDILCEHVYGPGPARRWSEPAGDAFLQGVYAGNHIDAILLDADRLASLNQFVAIQVDPGEGDFAARPITLTTWARQELAVWTDPDDRRVPVVVVTRDLYNEQTRYRLWTAEVVQTFLTRPLTLTQTAGGRIAYPTGPPQPHGYGGLPFVFICYELPTRGFPTGGISMRAVGDLLHKATVAIDDRLMKLDESISKHMNPIPVAEGMPELWKPDLEPQRFIRMPRVAPMIGATGGYERGEFAKLYYLQAQVDVQGAWLDLEKYINQVLEAARVPASAARMEQTGVASGISLMVEQEPLLKRAESRRAMYKVYEDQLARTILTVAGNHYGQAALLAARDAAGARLMSAWPPPRLAVLTMDTLELAVAKEQAGLSSHLMTLQEVYGCTRDEALELVRQIDADRAELETVSPDMGELVLARTKASLPGPGQENGVARHEVTEAGGD